ncbi:hypothetical protein EIP86_000988 [Pleurotus ostreatoroseus]|nr:hypothetical protein EIP86_000988 [Pleurotus ostreatoroseus]
MSGSRSPSPAPGRSIDIELSGQEIITVDLDNLDASPDDLLDLLRESESQVWVWTRLATEYWRRGYLDAAEKLAQGAVDRQDDMRKEKAREEFHREAAAYLNRGDKATAESGAAVNSTLAYLTRAILQLGNRNMDDALRLFDAVLKTKPTNVVALMGKARILYARRQYVQALRLFQDVLRYNPQCVPDPRIGIGLCLWALDQKERAKAAWERSLEVNPSQWPAQLLLGLEAINFSKNENQTEEQRRTEFLTGTRLIEKAFNANQKNSAAANALCELFLRKGQHKRALKLAERTIQFADTLTVLTDGYIRAGRVLQETGSLQDAIKQYTYAREGQPANVLASIGLAQAQLKTDEPLAAIHTLDTLLQPPHSSRSIEATVMLASLRAHPRPGVSGTEQTKEKARARELFDRVAKSLSLPEQSSYSTTNGNGQAQALTRVQRKITEDADVHVEIAKLWYDEDLARAERALREAQRLRDASGKSDPRILNNIAAVHHLNGQHEEARTFYQRALTDAARQDASLSDSMSTSILYNLARVYEAQNEDTMAKDAYEKLLARHPEYVDAKIRQAQMLADMSRHNEAHEYVKQALASQNSNLNLRAYYTHFLIQSNLFRPAKEFIFMTLKDFDKHDLYSICAAGWLQYHQARESRDATPKGIEERRRSFQRSAEFYEKALQLDPTCAIAAQGLAIVTAEDALGNLGGSIGPIAPDEAQKRIKNAREALDIFAKVRESLDDGSVYINMGHCYYASDEYDRAIESYETASRKFYQGHNVAVLLCLCRSWYAKANKDQSFVAMNTALRYAQNAFHLHPHDKAILYNIAMIEQKSAELLTALAPAKRTLKDLERATQQASHAQKIFQSLASDKSPSVPYSRDIADQRRKYGDSVLRRCDEHLASQKQYEAEMHAKLEEARRKRQEEKAQQEALEKERLEKLAKEAEELTVKRRAAREEAQQWSKQLESDEEEKERKAAKKAKGRSRVEDVVSGDEGEPRKKRRGKARKDGAEDDAGALFSEDEDTRPAPKKRPKKRVVRDDDDEENTGAPRKKQIKSKEFIEDSDEEMA